MTMIEKVKDNRVWMTISMTPQEKELLVEEMKFYGFRHKASFIKWVLGKHRKETNIERGGKP